MDEQIVKISNGKEYTVKEVKYKDMIANASTDTSTSAKFLLQASTAITDEEYETLNMKDGLALQNAVNQINGLGENFLQKASQPNNS